MGHRLSRRGRWRADVLALSAICAAQFVCARGDAQGLFGFAPVPAQEEPPAAAPASPAAGAAALARGGATQRKERRSARLTEARRAAAREGIKAARDGQAGSLQAGSLGERINDNTIAIVSGDLDTTDATLAYELSAVLDDGDNLRILPIIGKGGGQNIRDVRFMKGVDVGITQSNLLGYYKRTNQIGRIDDKIVYLAKLFDEEMHIVVKNDSGITAIADLTGKKVNFGHVDSGTQLTARDLFTRLGVEPVEVNLDQDEAMRQLKAGAIAASIVIAGKPAPVMTKLSAGDGVRLLPIPYPKQLQGEYLPATLSARDYPRLLDHDIDTVAVGAVLIAYNWPKGTDRYRRIETFVDAFFARLAELQRPPRHPKWRETNLAAVLPGWQRFVPAEEWLRQNSTPVQSRRAPLESVGAGRDAATADADLASPDRERLFRQFLEWKEDRGHR